MAPVLVIPEEEAVQVGPADSAGDRDLAQADMAGPAKDPAAEVVQGLETPGQEAGEAAQEM